MTGWRIAAAVVLAVVVLPPLFIPFLSLVSLRNGFLPADELPRLAVLGVNTLALAAGTVLLAVPAGTALAVLLYRTDLPGRRTLRGLMLLAAFVPLPLLVAGWESLPGGAPLAGRAGGLAAAVLVHALAGLPWVVVLVGHGLRRVERELEEEGLTATGPLRVLWSVTLPRARSALALAAVWVGLQAATEITVTDLFGVRTFAEEVYTQMLAEPAAEQPAARALALSLPMLGIAAWLAVLVLRRWERDRTGGGSTSPPLVFGLGRRGGVTAASVWLALGVVFGVPLAGLLWRAGLAGAPPEWSATALVRQVGLVMRSGGAAAGMGVGAAGVVGVVAAVLALGLAWLCLEGRRLRRLVLALAVLAWVLPGPVVGLGMKGTIEAVLSATGSATLEEALYRGRSWLPVVWVQVVRLWPVALAILWPVVSGIPARLRETARADGAGALGELRHVVLPAALPAALAAALAVTALALGELGASKLVSTPGARPFAEELFVQLHYRTGADVAVRALLLLAVVGTTVGGAALARRGRDGWP